MISDYYGFSFSQPTNSRMVSPLPAVNLRSRKRLGIRRVLEGSRQETSLRVACVKWFLNERLSIAPSSMEMRIEASLI